MKKKFFGLLLTAAMCLSLLPSTALAEETVAQTQELTEQEQPVAEEIPAEAVVKIENGDTTTYGTDLAAAMNDAEDGTTITLLDDITNLGNVKVSGDKTITLELDGHSISGSGKINLGEFFNSTPSSCPSNTLKISGTGDIQVSFEVNLKCTLDLSGWTGDTIQEVVLNDNSFVEEVEREPALIVGKNAGHMNRLFFSNWQLLTMSKSNLSGGSYGQICVSGWTDDKAPLGSMLADGYAFQKEDGTYVEYTKTLQGGYINDLKVVPCPHEKVENGTCAYCNTSGIAATLGTEIYTENNIAQAFNFDWQTIDGATLTLHQDCSLSSNIGWYGVYNGTLDLNGHTLTMVDADTAIDVGGGSTVTIVDNSASGGGKIDGRVWISWGSLTLESGEFTALDVSNMDTDDVTVKLRGGKVTSSASSGNGTILVYRLLEDGYYLEGSALLAKFSGGPYEVKSANITVGGEKTGEIAIGKNIVNIPVSLTLPANTSTTAVKFDWYLVGTNGNDLSMLASQTATVTDGVAAYDPTTANASMDAGWDSLKKDTDYTLVCMATGMAGANVSWQAALTGYTLHMLPPSIEDAKITFAPGWQEKIFWPDADNNSIGKTEMLSGIDAYVVTLGNSVLTEGTDYRVISGNIATGIGPQDLTIKGIAPKYSGTKTAQWTVVPHTLKMLQINQSSKQYDGTDALPDGALVAYFESEVPNYNQQIILKEGTDYVVTDARFDTPDASNDAKGYRYTVELKNPNYVFTNGTRVQTAVYGKGVTTAVRITKADAPTAKQGALTVENSTAAEYTFDLASLLPALESPKEYGTVTYTVGDISLGDYYNTKNSEARIADGKLILPIQSVNTSTTGAIGTVTINAVSTNYKDIPLTIAVSAENRKTTGGGGSKKHNTPSTPKEEKPSDDTTTEDNTTKENFADVPADAWFKDAVEYVSDNGLMSGVDKDNFAPKVLTNRAMLVTILWRLESCPTGGQTTEFSDIKVGDYFHNAVLWAAENKIVSGVSETGFAPNDSITREQLAAILYRYAVYKGYDVTQGGMAVREFSDYESISDYARGSVAWAVNTGILSGKGENILDPKGVATRAEVASMLMRFCENIAK